VSSRSTTVKASHDVCTELQESLGFRAYLLLYRPCRTCGEIGYSTHHKTQKELSTTTYWAPSPIWYTFSFGAPIEHCLILQLIAFHCSLLLYRKKLNPYRSAKVEDMNWENYTFEESALVAPINFCIYCHFSAMPTVAVANRSLRFVRRPEVLLDICGNYFPY